MLESLDIQQIIRIAQMAGEEIMAVYQSADFSVEFKGDDSPLTAADKRAHIVIMEELTKLYPKIPILSEEGREMNYDERKDWDTYWCVDPLDGTKEFIKRNGQFTVNIALIKDRRAIAGVIYTPVTKTTYSGVLGLGAWKHSPEDADVQRLRVNFNDKNRIAVRSRSHASEAEDAVLESYGVTDSISVGSSLKFCMVAEGKADLYYRAGPTMEWDTAAGQAILEAAGGTVFIETSDVPFRYNKEALLNTGFLCLGF
jgi:3'(2'), 5'-bisphosphate nucleotidase